MRRPCAGYGWQVGWYFQMAWQVSFALDTRASLWACLSLLLGALAGFAITLLSLYRRARLWPPSGPPPRPCGMQLGQGGRIAQCRLLRMHSKVFEAGCLLSGGCPQECHTAALVAWQSLECRSLWNQRDWQARTHPTAMFRMPRRLKDTCGSLSRVLLYIAYFAPTTINTAWLSVAAGVGVLIMPQVFPCCLACSVFTRVPGTSEPAFQAHVAL